MAGATLCRDCGDPTDEWWSSWKSNPGMALRRCRPCYNALMRARPSYRRQLVGVVRRPRVQAQCLGCGAMLSLPRERMRFCSVECQRLRRADVNRRKNLKRKLARTSATTYSLLDIATRDGWRCHLCRRRVRADLPGTHQLGPTVDHLLPVRDGGLDEPDNVALAHRRCNVARGAGGEVQLRLVG